MIESTRTSAALRDLIRTGDEADRCYAARTLGVLGAESAVEELTQCLRDEDIDVCVDAAEALGQIGDLKAVASLLESLDNEADGEVCTSVVSALARLGGDQVTGVLKRLVHERPENLEWVDGWDSWWDIQLAAVKGLAQHGDESAVEPLLAVLDDEDPQDIENEIMQTLARLGEKGQDALFGILQSGPARARRRAAAALSRLNTPEVAKALSRALLDEDANVRVAAVEALEAQEAKRYLSTIILLLRHENEFVRRAAAQAAVRLGGAAEHIGEIEATLAPLLRDPSPEVRIAAMDTLARSGDPETMTPETLDLVLANFDLPIDEVAESAAGLLGRISTREGITQILIAALADSRRAATVRRGIALTLGEFLKSLGRATPDITDALRQGVVGDSPEVRLGSLIALQGIVHLPFDLPRQEETPQEETAQTQTEEENEEVPQSPLQIIIAAARGEIEIPVPEEIVQGDAESAPQTEQESQDTEAQQAQQAQVQNLDAESLEDDPELLRQLSLGPDAEPAANEPVPLPETAPEIPEDATVPQAMSTLDAIAMDNVQVALQLDEEPAEDTVQEDEPDPELEHVMGLVERERARNDRMFPKRHVDVADDVRLMGVRVLGQIDKEEAVLALIELLNDPALEARREAAEAISQVARKNRMTPGLDNAFGALVTLMTLEGMELKIRCARALGHLGNKAAVQPLLDALDDVSNDVRIEAIRALAELTVNGRDPKESDHMVIRDVAPRSIARKISTHLDDDSSGIRVAAGRALARILELEDAKAFTGEALNRIIDAAFNDAGQQARYLGQSLRAIDPERAEKKLLKRLDEAPDSIHRRFVIEMLEELFKPATAA